MNRTIIIGNLTADPKSYSTTSGKSLTKFSVAVNEGKVTEYINVTAYEHLAEICKQYLTKGSKVCVTGKVTTYAWVKDGEAHSSLGINAATVEFMSKRNEDTDFGSMPDTDADLPWD